MTLNTSAAAATEKPCLQSAYNLMLFTLFAGDTRLRNFVQVVLYQKLAGVSVNLVQVFFGSSF